MNPSAPMAQDREWFYILDGRPQGPLSQEDLKHIFSSCALPWNTPVWADGLSAWTPAEIALRASTQIHSLPAAQPEPHQADDPVQKSDREPSTSVMRGVTVKWMLSVAVIVAGVVCATVFIKPQSGSHAHPAQNGIERSRLGRWMTEMDAAIGESPGAVTTPADWPPEKGELIRSLVQRGYREVKSYANTSFVESDGPEILEFNFDGSGRLCAWNITYRGSEMERWSAKAGIPMSLWASKILIIRSSEIMRAVDPNISSDDELISVLAEEVAAAFPKETSEKPLLWNSDTKVRGYKVALQVNTKVDMVAWAITIGSCR